MNYNQLLRQLLMGIRTRRLLFVVTGLVLAGLGAPLLSFAAGNVLLPSDNDKGYDLPNLGLGVQPKTSVEKKPVESNNPESDSFPNLGLTVQPKKPADSAKTPDSDASKPKDKEQPKIVAPASPARPIESPELTSVQQLDVKEAPVDKRLPHNFNAVLGKDSSLGENDVMQIQQKLGLRAEEISSSCAFAIRGMIMTNKNTYGIGNGVTPQATVYYDGAISNCSVTTQILCRVNGALPRKSGMLTKMNGRYALALGSVDCPKPRETFNRLVVTYNGNGAIDCDYQ